MKSFMNFSRKAYLPILLIALTFGALCFRAQSAPTVAASPAAAPRAERPVLAEGRVSAYPGAEVVVGTDVAGVVTDVLVHEKDTVRKGQLIAELRSNDLRAALNEARAKLGEADADIRLYEAEAARAKHLWEQEVGSRQNYDRAMRDIEAAKARRETAAATVARLEATVGKTQIVSPIDGVVIARSVERGQAADAGSPIATIADLSRVRIDAEVDEFDIGRVRPGAPVEITADGFDGQAWKGRVEEIPDSVVQRKLKPEDPGRLSDGRVLLVKVAFEEPSPVKLGQRVEVKIAR